MQGCTIIPDWLTPDRATSAIRQARIVVHLAGTLNPPGHDYERANLEPAQRVASSVVPGRTGRVIFLSYVGASEESANRYLATKARAEHLLQATRVPVTVFRCTHIIGSPQFPGPTAASFLANRRNRVTVLGGGRQRVAPVYVCDVVAAIEAAMASERDGTFNLQGPDEMTFDDLVRVLNRRTKVSIVHVPSTVALLLHFFGPRLPSPLIDIMIRDSRSEHPTAHSLFGLSLTHLDRVWSQH
jgi:nucleoside-diphosphate-sugar epimerase